MGDNLGVRLRLVALIEILTLYTDECNLLTTDEIIDRLGEYGYDVTRRTVLSDLKELNRTSFKVICVNSPAKGYYLAKSYSQASLHLLLEAVYSSTVLTDDDVADLQSHLRSTACIPTLELLAETTENLNFRTSKVGVPVDILRTIRLAIHTGKRIRLSLLHSVPGDSFAYVCDTETITVNPWRIVITSESVALVFTLPQQPDEPKFVTLRRISGAELLDEPSNNKFDGDPLVSLNYYDGGNAVASMRKHEWVILSFKSEYAELVENHFDFLVQYRRSEQKGLTEAKVFTLVDEKLIGWLYLHADKITALAPRRLTEIMSR